jgi:hypothetical protein
MDRLLRRPTDLPLPGPASAGTALFAVAALAGIYVVLFDQGLLTAGSPVAHELFHDARHLLGVPCH